MKLQSKYPKLIGSHAFLSPSGYHWLGYDNEKLIRTYKNHKNVERGIAMHDLAKRLIDLGVMLPRKNTSINAFVNDAIGFAMSTEILLYYSPFCFGTADAISFDGQILRIHDLKTGNSTGHIKQLLIYSALFCLEYDTDPRNITFELRIYHNDTVTVHLPGSDEILTVMKRIIESSILLSKELSDV